MEMAGTGRPGMAKKKIEKEKGEQGTVTMSPSGNT
jgi:hypothetical protein